MEENVKYPMHEKKYGLFDSKPIRTLKEWALYNFKMTGVNVMEEDIKNCVMVVLNPGSIFSINKQDSLLIDIKKPLKFAFDKIVYLKTTDKSRAMATKTYGTNVLVLRKDDEERINKLIKAMLYKYTSSSSKLESVKKKRNQYVNKQIAEARKEALKKFPLDMEKTTIEELLNTDIEAYTYLCPKCEESFIFNSPQLKCKKCGSYLIDLEKEKVRKDYS